MSPSLTEKYRPSSFGEVCGQSEVVGSIEQVIKRKELPHFFFIGPAGSGKTSVAHIMAKTLGYPFREFNASDERGIDVVRNEVKRLSKTMGNRVLLLDEIDNMTADAQQALRRIMETTKSTLFVLTGNKEWKIIDPIKSRCTIYRFNRLKDEDVLRRILKVCGAEGIKITSEARPGLIQLVKDSKGDLRMALNTLEKLVGESKEITEKNIIGLRKPKIAANALSKALDGDFEGAKNMLEDSYINCRFNVDDIVNELYEAIGELNDRRLKIKLYIKLSDTEHRCKVGSNPLVQLVSFISWAWILPHLKGDGKGAD